MNTNTLTQIDQFLIATSGQKEVSLVIAQDQGELEELRNTFNNHNFQESASALELLEKVKIPSKNYLIVDPQDRGFYEFTSQYPTGQVELFDKINMKSLIANPSYQGTSVVFVIMKPNLVIIQQKDIDLLSSVGLTYQR